MNHWARTKNTVSQYWLFSIIQTDATTWLDRNQDEKINSTFKIKRSKSYRTQNLNIIIITITIIVVVVAVVLHYTDYQQYTSNMLQCQYYITPALLSPFHGLTNFI